MEALARDFLIYQHTPEGEQRYREVMFRSRALAALFRVKKRRIQLDLFKPNPFDIIYALTHLWGYRLEEFQLRWRKEKEKSAVDILYDMGIMNTQIIEETTIHEYQLGKEN